MSDTTNNFCRLVVEDVPLIDVRAPVEFDAGTFPNAVNLPLMNNDERHQVGICYKKHGQEQAIQLGHQLVSGEKKEQRIAAWKQYVDTHPNTIIFCFRGGLRSRLSQQWASAACNRQIQRLEGGYKAFRHYLINQLEEFANYPPPIILGGRTGVNKTRLLKNVKNMVDLEGLANHRGSAFGAFINPQPTQIDFENALAYALIKHQAAGHSSLIIEDEGRHIGRRFLPQTLADHFAAGKVVVLEASFEERVENTLAEYVTGAQAEFQNQFGENGITQWYESIVSNIVRIRKRLGGERQKRVMQALDTATSHQKNSGTPREHTKWIEILLREYYDPMYDYQLQQKNKFVIFQGNFTQVQNYFYSVYPPV